MIGSQLGSKMNNTLEGSLTVGALATAIEAVAPLRYQDGFDNSGLQVGFTDSKVNSVLISLDITEEVLREAREGGYDMIVSHHPLLFHPLKQVSDRSYQQRCVVEALRSGIAIYSAHTSLDNARGGVNYEIASRLGLRDLAWLQAKEGCEDAGSGVVGTLPEPEWTSEFLKRLQSTFGVKCLKHTHPTKSLVQKIALCGGSGAFLIEDARKVGADCFISGEMHYHDFFASDGMMLVELGHWESERFTVDLLERILKSAFPTLKTHKAKDSNPIIYDI